MTSPSALGKVRSCASVVRIKCYLSIIQSRYDIMSTTLCQHSFNFSAPLQPLNLIPSLKLCNNTPPPFMFLSIFSLFSPSSIPFVCYPAFSSILPPFNPSLSFCLSDFLSFSPSIFFLALSCALSLSLSLFLPCKTHPGFPQGLILLEMFQGKRIICRSSMIFGESSLTLD